MRPPPFQTFLENHRDSVYRFLVFSVGPDAADDCLQETFIAALRAYPRLADGSNLRAWVLTIAHRKAIDAHRARARRPVPAAELPERPAPAVTLPDPGLWKAVGDLPPKQGAAIVLRFVSDLPFLQVGRILDISEAAARQNVREGLAHLRKEYADDAQRAV
ncbi:MAG TPA: RNA polymerase sigma factor [Acidimicrobiia bacterium]|nr:RNA polymerase sigma factor [Acidimicrobiia bacterium]